MKTEYDLKKLKKGRRGPLASPDAKVLKTLRLDPEVLSWFRVQGEKQGIPYQTLMNATLRQAMHSNERNLPEEIRQIIREELNRKTG